MSIYFITIKPIAILTGVCSASHPEPRVDRGRGEDGEENRNQVPT
jgi:hypothetical protein